ncbi:LEAF RUST 10 DISEASE-RESISTANCE LOCUS RECEPTOR-LIKE PROTEIN KINASE-like 1.2 isoform X3 [Ipomoea triloba]|uniref:LEAF RUST 10 DISEASE-RESISTANCE LOCUS RECEPTOR-LIKE PROTEIN KINASE-like 1.2 isoform X3 n=1 Tax=Ipomoea triloba TaxID=35885 RepID=UPI00125DDD63|nr:LEAF RUST 10 DISEASE-RESISTANCE LOCUS RECEPTOR-LIKE PROTEIN KINASE-like 1.2 isoform X3 [Ipomoea triloba]
MFKSSTLCILFFISLYEAQSSNSTTCNPQDCGNGLKVSFPFWIQNKQESNCGLPAYTITCDDDKPVIKIRNDDYILKNIFYSNNSFRLAKSEVFDEDNECPVPRSNFSTEGTPFSYGPDTDDLFFFYGCTKPYEMETYSVDCASNGSHHSFADFHTDLFEHYNYSVESCQPPVNTPVETEAISKLVELNYTQVLKRGFVLQWDGSNCSECEKSGGNCGSYNNEFCCFCHNQIQNRTCPHGNKKTGLKIGLAIGGVAFGFLLGFFCLFAYRRQKKRSVSSSYLMSRSVPSNPSSSTIDLEGGSNYHGVPLFDYTELEEATNSFDARNELGDGGFGTVYKGKLRDGRVVAVKRLYENNYKRVEQFMNEIEILARMRHKNLVTLYGCTSRNSRELLLVYEYVPNGTIADHLHGERARPGLMCWATRLSIAVETASALAYLHLSDVIHRDVKTNNILLDNNFCVKVADFGLSRLFPIDVTHVSTAPQGTPGYVDPEYHECYQLTSKSDVYSFGVVLVELISSLPAVDITRHRHEINLSNMAINKIQCNALHELVDKSLGFESDVKIREMISAVAELAFQCLQSGKDMRPSMPEVLESLLEIQNMDSNGKTDSHSKRSPTDSSLLLKNIEPAALSPNSVITAQWPSRSTTNNSSSSC